MEYYNTLFKKNPRTNIDELEYIPKRKFTKQEKEEFFSYSPPEKNIITVPQRAIIKPNVIDESPNSHLDINNYMKVADDTALLKKHKKVKALKKSVARTQKKTSELKGGSKSINNFMDGLFKYLNK